MVPIPVAAVLEPAPPPFVISSLPACRPGALSLTTDGEDGAAGHRGTLLVLRNLGGRPCRVPGLLRLLFAGPDGRPLAVAFRPPAGMHPGPVVLPVGIAPDAEVTAELTWTAPGPYDPGLCLRPATVSVVVGGRPVSAPFGLGPLCGPASGPVLYGVGRFHPDARVRR